MPPLEPFEQLLETAWPASDWQDVGVVVAVSGGADSVALLRGLSALKQGGVGRLTAAHFNHGWRGAASDADEAFVADLCRQRSLECAVSRATGPPSNSDFSEAAARDQRYTFLRETAEQQGARFVAVAHTADDQAETVLHHVLRGTGLQGLAGMSRTRPLGPAVTLLRPMLGLRHSDVLAYLAALDQPFREDATNQDTQYLRNRIRQELLPQLVRDYAPGAVESLLRLSTIAADAQHAIETMVQPLRDRAVVEASRDRVVFDCRALTGQDRHVVRELFAAVWKSQAWPLGAMGFAEWNGLADMADARRGDGPAAAALSDNAKQLRTSKRVFPGGITATTENARLTLSAPAGGTC